MMCINTFCNVDIFKYTQHTMVLLAHVYLCLCALSGDDVCSPARTRDRGLVPHEATFGSRTSSVSFLNLCDCCKTDSAQVQPEVNHVMNVFYIWDSVERVRFWFCLSLSPFSNVVLCQDFNLADALDGNGAKTKPGKYKRAPHWCLNAMRKYNRFRVLRHCTQE